MGFTGCMGRWAICMLSRRSLTRGFILRHSFLILRAGKPTILDEPNPNKDPSQFTAQADYFSDCIVTDKTPKTAGEEGLLDMQYMSKIYQSCGLPSL